MDTAQDGKKYKHLRIVISHISEDNRALVIPVSTIHSEFHMYDDTCILLQGEHSFLTEQKSYAVYSKAEALSKKDLDDLERNNKLISYEDVSVDLLQRLQEGARNSPYLAKIFTKYFSDF